MKKPPVTRRRKNQKRNNSTCEHPLLQDLKVENRAIPSLKAHARNARTHTKAQVRQIARSIQEFGFLNPILIDRDGGIIAGHGRVKAAEQLDYISVPTIRVDHLSAAQKRAYVIADNRLAELAGWDEALLALELQYLSDIDIDLDVTITGFETPEIDLMIEGLSPDEDSEADYIPDLEPDSPPLSQAGDLWRLGPHRLLCGDALKERSFDCLLAGQKAQMVITDPPYNVPIDGHVCGLGAIKHDDFQMASGEMNEFEFTNFLETVFRNLAGHSRYGSLHFVFMDWRHVGEMIAAGKATYSELKNLCVWAKTNGGMGSLYRSQHELVFVFKSGTGPHINNIELGRHGRYRTNLWTYAGVNSFGHSRDEALAMHPTVKPVALVADAILDCSERKGIILDAFAGSGTTLIAAERTGRRGYGIELDPHYCDVIIRRMGEVTGLEAIHAESGKTFSDLEAEHAANDQVTINPDEEAA